MVDHQLSDRGFIALWRAMMESWIWQLSPSDFKIAITCLLLANWEDRDWFDGKAVITILRGSFVDSTEKLAKKCGKGVSRKMVRGALSRLEVSEFLTLGTTKGQAYTLVTIVNYDRYQVPKKEKGQGKGQGNEGLPKKEAKATKELHENANKCANYLRNHIIRVDPDHRLSRDFTPAKERKWSEVFDAMERLDNRSWEEIKAAIKWLFTTQNKFVVFSPASLRTKFDNVRKAIKDSNTSESRKPPPPKEQLPEPSRPTGETVEEWKARKELERSSKGIHD